MGRRKSKRRTFGRRRKSPETLFWTIVIVLLIFAGAAFGGYYILFGPNGYARAVQNNPLPVAAELELSSAETSLWEPKTPENHTSILLLGLDDHGMCDVVMIFSFDMETYEASLISLQRDTYVPQQTWAYKESGQDHLAWANNRGMGLDNDYHAGARLTAQTVEELLGIDLHAYASITFDGFVELVDLIGGVTIEVAPAFADRQGGALPTGLQQLTGAEALIYARHRQNPRIPEPGSDSQAADRVIRNQRLLKALLEQCKSLGSETLAQIIDTLDQNLFTSMDDWAILELANILVNRDLDELETLILPGQGETVYQERIDNETYYYFLDIEACDFILQELGLK